MELSLEGWLANTVGTAVLLSSLGYMFRETLLRFFTSSVEHRFNSKLESVKAALRAKETELDHIMSFLSSQKQEREALLLVKRVSSAEIVLRTCDALAQLSMLVEFMKILNVEEILKRSDGKDAHEIFASIVETMQVDAKLAEIGAIDQTLPRLYLDDHTLELYNAYKAIISHAIMIIKLLTIPNSHMGLMKEGILRKQIEEIVPSSKEGFDIHGENYAYYWEKYFYNETLKALRSAVNGGAMDQEDTVAVTKMTVTSQQVQMEAREKLESSGLPRELIIDALSSPDIK